MKFKYYVTYGNPKDPNWGPEDRKKAFDEFAEAIKKYNLKLMFWGGAFGVSEGMMFVLKGIIKNYESFLGDPETFSAIPVKNTRTHMIFEM